MTASMLTLITADAAAACNVGSDQTEGAARGNRQAACRLSEINVDRSQCL